MIGWNFDYPLQKDFISQNMLCSLLSVLSPVRAFTTSPVRKILRLLQHVGVFWIKLDMTESLYVQSSLAASTFSSLWRHFCSFGVCSTLVLVVGFPVPSSHVHLFFLVHGVHFLGQVLLVHLGSFSGWDFIFHGEKKKGLLFCSAGLQELRRTFFLHLCSLYQVEHQYFVSITQDGENFWHAFSLKVLLQTNWVKIYLFFLRPVTAHSQKLSILLLFPRM